MFRINKVISAAKFANKKCNLLLNLQSVYFSHSSSQEDSKRLVKLALMGNMAITCAKAACWLGTGSSAMLSETVHSLVDSGNQALLLIGLRGADALPDKAHPCKYTVIMQLLYSYFVFRWLWKVYLLLVFGVCLGNILVWSRDIQLE